ncbi:MAG: hypothetical protein WAS21_03045 [Geminicoccaceae bacterium]
MKASLELVMMRKVAWRLVLLLCALHIIAFIIRTNGEFIPIIMGDDLGLNSEMLGWGAGLFFIPYFFFAVPGNSMLHHFGARRGGAEAGPFPGAIVASTRWFAEPWRGRVTAALAAAIPISSPRIANRPRHQPA